MAVAFGGAESPQGARPVRLAAEAFLLCVRVVAGCAPCRVTQLTLGGCAPRPPNAQAAAGYALKVPAAHFYVGFSRNQIKINTL